MKPLVRAYTVVTSNHFPAFWTFTVAVTFYFNTSLLLIAVASELVDEGSLMIVEASLGRLEELDEGRESHLPISSGRIALTKKMFTLLTHCNQKASSG